VNGRISGAAFSHRPGGKSLHDLAAGAASCCAAEKAGVVVPAGWEKKTDLMGLVPAGHDQLERTLSHTSLDEGD